jgi:hypothetical protein
MGSNPILATMKIPRWLELQQEIDFRYFVLSEISKGMPKNGLDSLIDEVTGFDKKRKDEICEICTEMKNLKKEWMKETGEEVSLETEDKIIKLCGG